MSTLQSSSAAWSTPERYDGIDTGATAALTDQRRRPVAAFRDRPAEWRRDALAALNDLFSLKENWDSYGARPVSPGAIKKGKDFIKKLSWILNVKAPTVTATTDGDVAFCWDAGRWSLDVSIDSSGLISYVFLDEENPEENLEVRTQDTNELVPLLTQWGS